MRARGAVLPALAIAASVAAGAPARADQVVADDLVVQGNGNCVGTDCTIAETFPFASLRLKENNLRIHFDDTTDPLAGPGNDWRITANDSAPGGGEYLRIEDATSGGFPFRVDGAAPTDALVVATSGAVGVGTGTPAAQLHVAGTLHVDGDLEVIGSTSQAGGIVPASALSARTGTVTFAAPIASPYAIALTPIGATPGAKLEAFLTDRDAGGFTFAVAGRLADLAGVAWTIRRVDP